MSVIIFSGLLFVNINKGQKMGCKVRFIPKSTTMLEMRNMLNDTHDTLVIYQDYLVDEFLSFMKAEGKVLTFRRLLAEARKAFGKYSKEILELNPNSYTDDKGREKILQLLISLKSSSEAQNEQQQAFA